MNAGIAHTLKPFDQDCFVYFKNLSSSYETALNLFETIVLCTSSELFALYSKLYSIQVKYFVSEMVHHPFQDCVHIIKKILPSV